MKFKHFCAALLSGLALSLASCGDPEENVEVEIGDMNVDEIKEYVGNVANEASELLLSVKEEIQFFDYFIGRYIDGTGGYYSPEMGKFSRSRDLYEFANVYGIYRWNGYEFVYQSEADYFKAVVPNDPKYGEIVVYAKASNDGDIVGIEGYDESYDVKIPHSFEGYITAGGKKMMQQNVTNSGINSKNVTATSTTTMGQMTVTAKGTASPTSGRVTTTISVKGQTLATATTDINGQKLTDIANWVGEEYDRVSEVIKSIVGKIDILGKVQLHADVRMTQELEDTDDRFYFSSEGYEDYKTKQEAFNAAKNAAGVYNKNIAGYFTVNNGSGRQAWLTFVPVLDYEYEYYGEQYGRYEIMPSMEFSDGTTYTDELFEGVFDNAINRWGFLFH